MSRWPQRSWWRPSACRDGVGKQNSAANGWKLVLQSEPRVSLCAVAFTIVGVGSGVLAGCSQTWR